MIDKEDLVFGNFVDYESTTHRITGILDEVCTSEWDKAEEEDPYTHPYTELKPIAITKEWALRLGFKEIPHYTVGGNLNRKLNRRRELSISCIGTPNEMMVLKEKDYNNPKEISDCIVLHNYDFDGYLSVHKLQNIIALL